MMATLYILLGAALWLGLAKALIARNERRRAERIAYLRSLPRPGARPRITPAQLSQFSRVRISYVQPENEAPPADKRSKAS